MVTMPCIIVLRAPHVTHIASSARDRPPIGQHQRHPPCSGPPRDSRASRSGYAALGAGVTDESSRTVSGTPCPRTNNRSDLQGHRCSPRHHGHITKQAPHRAGRRTEQRAPIGTEAVSDCTVLLVMNPLLGEWVRCPLTRGPDACYRFIRPMGSPSQPALAPITPLMGTCVQSGNSPLSAAGSSWPARVRGPRAEDLPRGQASPRL